MINDMHRALVASAAALLVGVAAAAPQPLENFARMPQIRDVAISPDGRYVAFISAVGDGSTVMTFDAHANGEFKRIAASDPGRFDLESCTWANVDRLVCGLIGNIRGRRYAEAPFTRTMAVDANGANIKTLDVKSEKGNLLAGTTSPQNFRNTSTIGRSSDPVDTRGDAGSSGSSSSGSSSSSSSSSGGTSSGGGTTAQAAGTSYSVFSYGGASGRNLEYFNGQRRDQLIDVTPEEHDTVLIQADDDGNSFPSVFALNVYTGLRSVRFRQSPPIRQFVTDGNGDVRLGWTLGGRADNHYFVRSQSGGEWLPLTKANTFTGERQLLPIGIARTVNMVYAFGEYEGRTALWKLDLTDSRAPEIVFSHARVDLGDPQQTSDRRLLGVRYDLEKPLVYYYDERLRGIAEQINSQYRMRFNQIVDMTSDEKTLVIRSSNEVDDGTYYLYDTEDKKLKKLGNAYPELKTGSLGTMKWITYKAADGTEIPGYLTVPSGVPPVKLPLIVLPHDGPAARDSWQFSFLRTFLANRGYAVLQMNYRGSSGYGEKWQEAAHQDWGGLTYSDITDATRWAIAQGIADPKRVCIAGVGFGGYAALLGAARNSDLYKCSISIAGFSDLQLLRDNAINLGRAQESYLNEQIGSDSAKLKKDSPLEQVAGITSPVLLIHGDLDWRVQIDQTKKMESALDKNKKEYKALYIKGAGHEFDRISDRVALLKAVEEFLQKNLGPGAQPGA